MSNKSIHRTECLLRILSDGKFHSGVALAENIGISRTAIWKLIKKIESWQIKLYSVRGRGYQIPGGLDLLDQQYLSNNLNSNNRLIKNVVVLTSIDSTADYLAKDWKQKPGFGRACIAEHQTAGRGRKGRPWISPFASNLYFSIGLQLPLGLSALGGLSLAVGISLCRSLNEFAQRQIKIKWPNDLMLDDRKLAGILVEASGDNNDSSFLNIGIGINWDMQFDQAEKIDQPWANLKSVIADNRYSRNQILVKIINDLDIAMVQYLTKGFSHFAKEWQCLSAFYLQKVTLFLPQTEINGIEAGVEANGALKLETEQGVQIFHSGEISLRKSRI